MHRKQSFKYKCVLTLFWYFKLNVCYFTAIELNDNKLDENLDWNNLFVMLCNQWKLS